MISVSGLQGSALSLFVAAIARRRRALFIAERSQIDRFYEEIRSIEKRTVLIDEERTWFEPCSILITAPEFVSRPIQVLTQRSFRIDQFIDPEDLLKLLIATGYRREDVVEEEMEFAVRGGVIDLYPPDGQPIRIELFGDKIVSLRNFNAQTQRSVGEIEKCAVRLSAGDEPAILQDLIDKTTLVISDRVHRIGRDNILLAPGGDVRYDLKPAPAYFGDLGKLKSDLFKKEHKYHFLLPYAGLEKRLKSVIGEIEYSVLALREGFVDAKHDTIYLTEYDIFGTATRKKRTYQGLFIDDLLGLKENDYVVHYEHGIGRFRKLTTIDLEDRRIECLQIDYAGTDKLFLPIERINLLERYVGTGIEPRLSRLGGELWLRVKQRVKKSTERLALDLLRLYSIRSQQQGHAYGPDANEMEALKASFAYEETPDQLKAIQDAFRDMESKRPAERLICGDVGYGKTEIALRLAFKAALEGKQTMIMCPTTLLAFQHYNTFVKRLKTFPVRVEMVSRFRSRKELSGILAEIRKGSIDIVIGTHRLLQPDVQFKDLGLMIIDEEQRFGVAQKEKIKNLKPGIDIFYLTATPIPRTLYMALTGLKSISNIHTPPPGRKDVVTRVIYYDQEEIRRIIKFEVERGGQIFFVHNRIQTIENVRRNLTRLLPEIRICLLHGRTRESLTEKRIIEFIDGKYDLLLSTAIIESGIDMPRVNTIIVDEAHNFGLGDLHQLRGRVGRGDEQAYAYFVVGSPEKLTPDAHQRLGALLSYTSLGSGFRLAMRDMEIRGVGSILGREQSGQINTIGYYSYVKMLGESISELRGQKTAPEPVIDLKTDAFFPDHHIPSAYERTALYKRLMNTGSQFELEQIKDEIEDRFGKFSAPVRNLLWLSAIRLKARELGADEVVRKGQQVYFYEQGKTIHQQPKPDFKT